MARREQQPDRCDHFTGNFAGRCGAGVSYDEVKDQDRRGQMARYPCCRSLDAFTTCALARFTPRRRVRRRIGLSAKNVGREVVFERGGGEENVRGRLVGWTDDGAQIFISVAAKRRKRRRVITAPAESCHLARKADDSPAPAAGELPLFDLRGVTAPQARPEEARRESTDKAA